MIQPQHHKWIANLLGYTFEVIYKPSWENKAVDALSRMSSTVHLNQLIATVLIDLLIIKEEVKNDLKLSEIVVELEKNKDDASYFTLHQGMLRYKNRLVISKTTTLQPTILCTCIMILLLGGIQGIYALIRN